MKWMFALNVQTSSQSDNIPNINSCLWEPELGTGGRVPHESLIVLDLWWMQRKQNIYSDASRNEYYQLSLFMSNELLWLW